MPPEAAPDPAAPCYRDHRAWLERLPDAVTPDELTGLLPPGVCNAAGQPIRFVCSASLGAVDYEPHVAACGEVPTRADCWHDRFNALSWARFPGIKAALNTRHCGVVRQHRGPGRGPVRDALTLFDEDGILVTAPQRTDLEALARHDWSAVFGEFHARHELFLLGHALLDKCRAPYKALTGNVLLVQVPATWHDQRRETRIRKLDRGLAAAIVSGVLLNSSSELAHLPLAGVPGWACGQDRAFYADDTVFRPPPDRRRQPVIWRMDDGLVLRHD